MTFLRYSKLILLGLAFFILAACNQATSPTPGLAAELETAVVLGGFDIDGVVPGPGFNGVTIADPFGNVKELGPVNASNTKVGVIHTAPPPMLDSTNPNAQVDLRRIWLDSKVDASNNVWLYFAWERDSNNGSGFIMFEFQQGDLIASCNYDGSEASLIAGCNPWANRQAGDFIILWDQQGNSTALGIRTFTGSGSNLTLGPLQTLNTNVSRAAFSSDRFKGEATINLSATVFQGESCFDIANVIPGTVTGNSDTADYKDTVLFDYPDELIISNCGEVKVIKHTDPVGGTESFGYTLTRTDGSNLSYINPPLTERTGTLVGHGSFSIEQRIIAGTNYTLSETSIPSNYDLVSISCTVNGKPTVYDVAPGNETFPVEVSKLTTCTITNRLRNPSLSIVKLTNGTDNNTAPGLSVAAGSTVTWTYNVTNTGNVSLPNVTVTDDKLNASDISCTPGSGNVIGTLAPGATATCTATGTAITGQYTNMGTVTSGTTTAQDPDNYFGAAPGINIDKVTNGADGLTIPVGSAVTWTYTVTNTGNVPLANVTVTDDKGVTPTYQSGDSNNDGLLDLTETWVYTAAGVAVAGPYSNIGTATSGNVSDTDPSNYFGAAPALSLVKTATPQTYSAVGDVIGYSYLVTNIGNVTLDGPVTVTDDKATVSCPAGGLAPAANMTCSASYTITQADLTAGSVTNTARAHANGTYSNYDDETVTVVLGALRIQKLLNGSTNLGTASFTFTVERCAAGSTTSTCNSPETVAGSPFTVNSTNNPLLVGNNLFLGHYRVTETSVIGYTVEPSNVQIVQVTATHTTANPATVTFNNIPTGDVCEDGKPRQLFMLYNGNGTLNDNHNQTTSEVIITVRDDVATRAHPVIVRTYDHQDKVIQTFRGVQIGDEIVFQSSRSGQLIPSRAGFRVFPETNLTNKQLDNYLNNFNNMLEHVQFHSSCSQPLAPGNEFGSFRLVRDAN